MKARFLKIFTASFFCFAVFSFFNCSPSFASENAWETGFEVPTYSTGGINGQDSWVNTDGRGMITDVDSYSGDQSLLIDTDTAGSVNVNRVITGLDSTDDTIRFMYKAVESTDVIINMRGTLHLEPLVSNEYFCTDYKTATTQTFKIGSPSASCATGVEVGDINVGTWYLLEMEMNYTNDSFKARIDEGTWSSSVNFQEDYDSLEKIWFLTNSSGYPQSYFIDDFAVGEDNEFDAYDYGAWGDNLWNQFYFHSPIPTDHYIIPGTNYDDPDNYIFPIATGNSEQPIWMFHHDGLYHDAEYYKDYITLEVLDAMQGSVTYTHIIDTDLYFLDDSDNEVMIFYSPGALADTVQKHFALRFHNLADDENYIVIYFTLVGDADYWAYGDMTPYDMCETFDSTWSKAICHMIVPAPDFFSNNFAELKAEFESAFPFLFQIRTIVLASASEVREASTDTPTMPASSEWKGMSIQLWDMSVVAPYMETLRSYMSIVLWGMFIYYLLHQVLLLLKPNE